MSFCTPGEKASRVNPLLQACVTLPSGVVRRVFGEFAGIRCHFDAIGHHLHISSNFFSRFLPSGTPTNVNLY